MTTGRRGWVWLLGAAMVLAAAVVIGVMIGPAGGVSSANWNIIWNVRMPRVALAAIVGAMLSLAGASYQGVFRNPLVDPYLLGAAGGAGLGATFVIAYGRTVTSDWLVDPLPLAAFAGALVDAGVFCSRPPTGRRVAGGVGAWCRRAVGAAIRDRQLGGAAGPSPSSRRAARGR